MFNNKGEVIGIATFGSIDQNSGQEIQGMNFAVPVSIAKQFLNELNIKPAESALTKSYKSALALFHQDKYKKALKMFKDINDINPGYPYIQDYISQCSVNIDAGKDKSSDVTKYIIIGVIAFAAIGLIIAAVIILSRKFNFKIEVKSRTPAPDAENRQDPPQQ